MGSGDYMQRAQQLKTQQDLTNSAADTTASLQRTRQLMAEVSLRQVATPCSGSGDNSDLGCFSYVACPPDSDKTSVLSKSLSQQTVPTINALHRQTWAGVVGM